MVISWLVNLKGVFTVAEPKYNRDLLNHQLWDVLPRVEKMACRYCQKKRGDIRGDRRLGWAICKKCHSEGFRFYFDGPRINLFSPEQVKVIETGWLKCKARLQPPR